MTPSAGQVVEQLQADGKLGPQLRHVRYLPAEPCRYGGLKPPLPPALARGLERLGVGRLWAHQAKAIEAVRRRRNVLVTTPTASGKSLVFHLPVLEEVLRGGSGRALYLFPLKALGQDQKGKLDRLAAAAGLVPEMARCEIYDGDTPPGRRQSIKRTFPRVVISNPDMLHLGILSHWGGWTPFLRQLRWVVLDELHTYRGIFGSHFHHVLQRLWRLCRAEGSQPTLVVSSATASNAGEFAETLTGQSFTWITESGAPREGRHLLLFESVASPYTTVLDLLVQLLEAGLKTIVFTKARRITELLYSWLGRKRPDLAARVASYRAGFLPQERRDIERALFGGRLDGVIATSALEMGIDVGGLDACILAGYPGSMMATWQRSGRVGRAGRESITALVALPDALDQYFLANPQELLQRPCERLALDPLNEPVSQDHLVCAAAERPLRRELDRSYLERHAALVGRLLQTCQLLETADGEELWARRRRPQRRVNLRGSGETYDILDLASERPVGSVDGVRVLHECHPGAVYLHGGRQYLVRELDLDKRKVRAERARLDYFTTPLTDKETEILEILDQADYGPLRACLGRLLVTERVVGFERKRVTSQETLEQRPLELPPVRFETVGLWWAVPRRVEEALRDRGRHFLGSLHACEHAAISLLPLVALCDRNDIGGISLSHHPQVGTGAVFIYDGHPGGVGICARGFQELSDLLSRVLELLESCACDDGCPSCVQSPKCGNGNRPLDKAGAAQVLMWLLGREPLAMEVPAAALPGPRLQEPAGEPATGHGGVTAEAAAVTSASPRPVLVAPRPGDTLLLDVETLRSAEEVGGWHNIHRMGLAVAVLCHLEPDRFEVFHETDVARLAQRLRSAGLVVGFNIKRFDYRVLTGYTGADYARLVPTLDLLEDVHRRAGFRLPLDHVAQETLGRGKSADGLQSLEWVKAGRLDLVESYCHRDVEVLRDLYLFGRREGYLLYRSRDGERRLRLPVEW